MAHIIEGILDTYSKEYARDLYIPVILAPNYYDNSQQNAYSKVPLASKDYELA